MTVRKLSFEAIGTKWTIDVSSEIPGRGWAELQKAIAKRIGQFDKTYSRFRADSWVSKLAYSAGTYELPGDALPLLRFYERLYKVTKGLVTPLIGQIMDDAGYDADYSFKSKKLSAPPAWTDVIDYSDHELTMKRPALLDFGAAGKGYLIDIVGGILQEAGIGNFVINAGGDILHCSSSGAVIQVGLENPFDTSKAIGIISIANQSLCASAGSRRAWGKYHHLINPSTLTSPEDIAATWVVADSAMQADGIATALFFVGPQHLSREFNFGYAILDEDMGLSHSGGLAVELFRDGA